MNFTGCEVKYKHGIYSPKPMIYKVDNVYYEENKDKYVVEMTKKDDYEEIKVNCPRIGYVEWYDFFLDNYEVVDDSKANYKNKIETKNTSEFKYKIGDIVKYNTSGVKSFHIVADIVDNEYKLRSMADGAVMSVYVFGQYRLEKVE